MIYDFGGIPEREMEKLRKEAEAEGKGSFAFAYYMDRNKEERKRGVTINSTTCEFFTDRYHVSIVDLPGHSLFIKNMITGASQADVACLLVPADGNFIASIAKEDRAAGVQVGQSRNHSLLLNLLGIKTLMVLVNKMDTCDYSEERYKEIRDEVKTMLTKTGWKKDFVKNSVPIIPTSGYYGENILKASEKMPWWKGVDVKAGDNTVKITCLKDALDLMMQEPDRKMDAALRGPVSGVYAIKGVGTVVTSRIEQGVVKPGSEVKFLPTHTEQLPCTGKVFSVEMHHKNQEQAKTGDNVGMNVKNLPKANMPRTGDVMVLASDDSLGICKRFTAQIQVLSHPGELKVGYCPIAFVRTGRAPIRLAEITWKMGKSTGRTKLENPPFLKAGEIAEVVFEPTAPFVVDSFKSCEGLGRVAIMEGNAPVAIGKVTKVEFR
jgi:elongation factor 1-alpha